MDDDEYLEQLMNQVEARKTDNLTQRGQPKGRYDKLEPDQKRIGRSTRYGNEFVMDEPHPDTGLPMTRDDVCDLFEERVLPNMDVEELRGKTLICCKLGERCHGDAIINKLHGTSIVNVRTLDDVATDVRSNLNKTVEGIIGAGKALQEGRDLHPSDQAFGNWCANEFPELHRKQRLRFMQIVHRFAGTEKSHQLGYSVLAELAAPSVSDDVVEQVINAPTPMKLAEVKALKKGISTGQKAPNTDPLVHTIDYIANCFLGVRANIEMHELVNKTGGICEYDLARAITLEVHKHYGDAKTEGVLLELKDIALQLSRAVEITLTETNHNVVATKLN